MNRKLIARAVEDNAWTVSFCPPKELYIPTEIEFKRTFKKTVPKIIQATAKEARNNGVQIEESVPDDKIVSVKILEELEEERSWSETRLCFNGRTLHNSVQEEDIILPKRGRRQKIRQEIAMALESPLSFLHHEGLVQMIRDEQDHWKSTNMKTKQRKPIILVLLGSAEPEGEEETEDLVYSRGVFLIKDYSLPSMTLISSEDETIELEFDLGLIDQCYIHNFILFVPSNVHLLDSVDKEKFI